MQTAELLQSDSIDTQIEPDNYIRFEASERPYTVLVVDDVLDYCEEIAFGLSRQGYKVYVASSGREAIDIGSLVRPDVLVTDWMLKDHVHGLAVLEALQLVSPSLQTVLITGFASQDLRVDARVADVFAFLEKPFPMDEMQTAVQRALTSPRPWRHSLNIGFMEVNDSGRVVFANYGAWSMLANRIGNGISVELSGIFGPDEISKLETAASNWVEVAPLGEEPEIWLARARKTSDDLTIYVLLNWKHRSYRYSAIVNRLLGLREPQPKDIQLEGHVLIVDDYEAVRRIAIDILRHFNCVGHTARTHEEAIRLFVHDVDIKHVILDFEMPDSDVEELVAQLRKIRPDVHIVGTSSGNNQGRFKALGVEHFLAKPWEVDQLLQMLTPDASTSQSFEA